MRRDVILALAVAGGLAASGSPYISAAALAEAATDKAQEEIKQIERARNQAILAGDAAALDRMTSDDYTFITQRGELRRSAITSGIPESPWTAERHEAALRFWQRSQARPNSAIRRWIAFLDTPVMRTGLELNCPQLKLCVLEFSLLRLFDSCDYHR